MSIPDHVLHASKGLAGFCDPMGDLIVDFGAAGDIAAQLREVIHRFQLGTIDIGCAVVSEEKFVDGGCGDTRAEVHPTLVKASAGHSVGDADPVAFFTPVAINRVKGFRQIHEGSVEVSLHLLAFLLQLSSGEDHFDCSSVSKEATLTLREQSFLQLSVQVIEASAGEDLSGDVQQRNSSVVVEELAVPFLLVEVNNGCVFEILRDMPLVPNLLEEHCEPVHQLGSTMLVNLSRDRVRARSSMPLPGVIESAPMSMLPGPTEHPIVQAAQVTTSTTAQRVAHSSEMYMRLFEVKQTGPTFNS
ncbi:unnamed protein product [Schistocephalus solidus]|uniref:Uncharacterized protein n=1 Tax=Schistocephalus solidus TaxID=70667 RepID=A0A183SRM8_SCHSO|nr:unnamed protein product [Schistocephalus solidus]